MKIGGFAFLAAAIILAVHAYRPETFDPQAAAPSVYSSPQVAVDVAPAPTRTFVIDNAPVLKSLSDRATTRSARAQPAEVLPVGVLPTALPSPSAVAATTVAAVKDPPAPASPATLVRDIKRELRRVGCYDGRIDSDWDGSAKHAAESFLDRVNASLPSQPDHVLLTLVRNHRDAACGVSCPSGQALSGEGRCMPNAIIAKMTRGSTTPAATADARPVAVTPFTTTVTVAEVQPTVGSAGKGAGFDATTSSTTTTAAKRAPLPGRMAMGAPGSGPEASGSRSWWDDIVGTPQVALPSTAQTLDRPAGLTHVPQPRPVARPIPGSTRTTTLATIEGVDAGPALQPAAIEPLKVEPARRVRGGRVYGGRRATRPRQAKMRHARRYSGRSVQVMFQHPLGRM